MSENFVASGYLDLKVPPGSPDRKLWKAWQYCWVVAKVDTSSSLQSTLELQLSQNKGDHRHQLLRIPSDGLRLFRGRSRSRPLRTWALAVREKAILYLAAESEAVAQMWMERLRDALWPPLLVSQIRLVTSRAYRVSLMDDEKTFRAGLLGAYGHLTATNNELTLVHPHSGNALLTCQLSDILKIQIAREVKSKNKGNGVFRLCIKSTTEEKNYYFYSQKAVEIVNWISEKRINDEQHYNNVAKDSGKIDISYQENIKTIASNGANPENFQIYDVPTHKQSQDALYKFISSTDSCASVQKAAEVKSNEFTKTNQDFESEIYDVPQHRLTSLGTCCVNNTKDKSQGITQTPFNSNSSNVKIDNVTWETFEIYDVPRPTSGLQTNNLNEFTNDVYARIQKVSNPNSDSSKTVNSDSKKIWNGQDACFNAFELYDVPRTGPIIETLELAKGFNTQVETACEKATDKQDSHSATSNVPAKYGDPDFETISSSTDFDLGDELDDDLYETINFDNRRWSVDSHIYSEIAPVRGSVGAHTIYEEMDDDDDDDNVAPPLPRRRIIYSEDSCQTPSEVRPRTSSALRLQMLSQSVNEALRQMEI